MEEIDLKKHLDSKEKYKSLKERNYFIEGKKSFNKFLKHGSFNVQLHEKNGEYYSDEDEYRKLYIRKIKKDKITLVYERTKFTFSAIDFVNLYNENGNRLGDFDERDNPSETFISFKDQIELNFDYITIKSFDYVFNPYIFDSKLYPLKYYKLYKLYEDKLIKTKEFDSIYSGSNPIYDELLKLIYKSGIDEEFYLPIDKYDQMAINELTANRLYEKGITIIYPIIKLYVTWAPYTFDDSDKICEIPKIDVS